MRKTYHNVLGWPPRIPTSGAVNRMMDAIRQTVIHTDAAGKETTLGGYYQQLSDADKESLASTINASIKAIVSDTYYGKINIKDASGEERINERLMNKVDERMKAIHEVLASCLTYAPAGALKTKDDVDLAICTISNGVMEALAPALEQKGESRGGRG